VGTSEGTKGDRVMGQAAMYTQHRAEREKAIRDVIEDLGFASPGVLAVALEGVLTDIYDLGYDHGSTMEATYGSD
jgi:hypothetical protein